MASKGGLIKSDLPAFSERYKMSIYADTPDVVTLFLGLIEKDGSRYSPENLILRINNLITGGALITFGAQRIKELAEQKGAPYEG